MCVSKLGNLQSELIKVILLVCVHVFLCVAFKCCICYNRNPFTDTSLGQSQTASAKILAVKLICIPNVQYKWEYEMNTDARRESPCFTKLN